MKKEMFKKLVNEFNSNKIFKHVSTVWKDDAEIHTYQIMTIDGENFDKIKELVNKNGYKDFEAIKYTRELFNSKNYYTLIYSEKKDVIRTNSFSMQYKYNHKNSSIYLKRIKLPKICFSKHFYLFNQARQPRILTEYQFILETSVTQMAILSLLNTKAIYSFNIPYKYYIDTVDENEVLERYFKIKLPKILKRETINKRTLFNVLCTLKDPNQINTICQELNRDKSLLDREDPVLSAVSNIMNYYDQWTLRDYLNDMAVLKLKELNLKVTSTKRITEEHRRFWRLRMTGKVSKITVNKKFNDIFDDLHNDELSIELITKKDRLLNETLEMNHCVATYANLINQGNTAIFSLVYKGERYTLQVDEYNGIFRNVQLRGAYNILAPKELNNLLDNYLLSISKVDQCELVSVY